MDKQKMVRVGAFFDGRPGHEKQTKGILSALQRHCSIELVEVKVERQGFWHMMKLHLNYLFGVGMENVSLAACDFLIGTGTQTHIPMLMIKKKYHVPVVTCMTPASYLLSRFDLIFSPRHDGLLERDNIVLTLGAPNENRDTGIHDEHEVLILIGGKDNKSHLWCSDDIIHDVSLILERNRDNHITVSSSPRTPEDTCIRLEKLLASEKNAKFFHFRDTPAGWVEKQYTKCKYVWVTEDSVSMIYEALSSGCGVATIPVQWKKQDNKFKKSLTFLRREGWIIELQEYLDGGAVPHPSSSLDEACRCADILLQRIEK